MPLPGPAHVPSGQPPAVCQIDFPEYSQGDQTFHHLICKDYLSFQIRWIRAQHHLVALRVLDQVLAVMVTQVQVELARQTVAQPLCVLLRPEAGVGTAQVAAMRTRKQPPLWVPQHSSHTRQVWEVLRDWVFYRYLAGLCIPV